MEEARNFFEQNVVGRNIRKYRIERKWSQEELSRRLEGRKLYICRGSISRIERQERMVTDYEVWDFAKVFKVSLYDMYKVW